MIVRAAVFPFLRSLVCLLVLTCSTAGCPRDILAGSPRVGETGRRPAVVIAAAASVRLGLRFAIRSSVFHRNTIS